MAPSGLKLSSVLKPFASSSKPAVEDSANAQNVPDIPRELVGPAAFHLRRELVKMYWAGVEREMRHILLTLQTWQRPPYDSTTLDDEDDHYIHGYDTFLEQLSQSTRMLAQKHGENIQAQSRSWREKPPSYHAALRDRCWDILTESRNSALKEEMRSIVDARSPGSKLQERARMLLQSAGFLDIDKVMEYRPPEKDIRFWKRPAVPQLKVLGYDEFKMPILGPETCGTCKAAIRGCSFRGDDLVECENCYRAQHYGRPDFVKHYKHCVLSGSITPEASRSICQCSGIKRNESDGSPRQLFPVDGDDHHRESGPASFRCRLFDLPDLVAQAKYRDILLKSEKHVSLTEMKRSTNHAKQRKRELLQFMSLDEKTKQRAKQGSLVDTKERAGDFDQSAFREYEDDVPIYMRPVVDKYPFGNVHMALRVGPLLIENGVKHSRRGVVITSRDPNYLQVILGSSPDIENGLLLVDDNSRSVFREKRKRTPKRYKCMMKQVVGGAFSGLLDPDLEANIVDCLIAESQLKLDPGLPAEIKLKALEQSIKRLVGMVEQYLGSRVEKYLGSIADRLIDPNTDLEWNLRTNNCQMFCDKLINNDTFGAVFPRPVDVEDTTPTDVIGPLYLMSFVCRTGSYDKETVLSRYDVPNGLTEEYLLKFRYGRHEESDIIDTLQEYWYDWGAFGRTIYPYQDVFPWDCTEAYNRYPTKCSDCNISKHVLAFPFDSWSIISLHLSRSRYLYPPPPSDSSTQVTTMDDISWFRNRLTILLAQSRLLSAAAAMHSSPSFQSATRWLASQPDAKLDRLKLGGIHRAQPYSHHFEKGAYHHYFVARWTHLRQEQKIEAYEALRDGRARKNDVKEKSSSSDDSSGGGPCDMGMYFWTEPACGNCGSGNCNVGGDDGDGGGGDGGGGDGGGCGGG